MTNKLISDNSIIQYLSKRYKYFDYKLLENDIFVIEGKFEKGIAQMVSNSKSYGNWLGSYLIVLDETYLCIDNTDGNCWCEEFKDFDTSISWLKCEFNVI